MPDIEAFFIDNGWLIDLDEGDSFCRLSTLVASTSVEVCFLCRLPYLDYDQKNESEQDNPEAVDGKKEHVPEDELATQFETEFGVYFSKNDKKTLFLEGIVSNGKLNLVRTYFLTPDMTISKHQELLKKDLLKNLHNGLTLDMVSDDVQYGLVEYLIVFGLTEEFFFNMQKLSYMRENELYQKWLRDFKDFVKLN